MGRFHGDPCLALVFSPHERCRQEEGPSIHQSSSSTRGQSQPWKEAETLVPLATQTKASGHRNQLE